MSLCNCAGLCSGPASTLAGASTHVEVDGCNAGDMSAASVICQQYVQVQGGPLLPAFFLPAKSINTALVVITVDLSQPQELCTTCQTWSQRIRKALQEQYSLLEKRNSPLPVQLKVCPTSLRPWYC